MYVAYVVNRGERCYLAIDGQLYNAYQIRTFGIQRMTYQTEAAARGVVRALGGGAEKL